MSDIVVYNNDLFLLIFKNLIDACGNINTLIPFYGSDVYLLLFFFIYLELGMVSLIFTGVYLSFFYDTFFFQSRS